jgi:hypothetical protein
MGESIQRWVPVKRSVGCGACGEVFETDAPISAACPHCGQCSLYDLGSGPSVGAQAVMQAWMLRDTHTRTESVGLVTGAALGGLVSVVLAATFRTGTTMLLIGYLIIAGAFVGAAAVVPVLRRLAPSLAWVDRAGARRMWLKALVAWAVLPPLLLGGLYLLGGGGRSGPALRRGIAVLWSKIVGG